MPADSVDAAPAADDRHDVPRDRQHQPRGAGQEAARGWTSSTSSSTRSARRSSARRSAAPAATTTSSTRSPPPTTTRWPASSAARKAMEHANVSKWIDVPLPEEPAVEAELKKHEEAVAARAGEARRTRRRRWRRRRPRTATSCRRASKATVVAVKDLPGIVVDDEAAKKVGEWKHSTSVATYIGDGYLHDDERRQGREVAHVPARAAASRPVRSAAVVHAGQEPGDQRAGDDPQRGRRGDRHREPAGRRR